MTAPSVHLDGDSTFEEHGPWKKRINGIPATGSFCPPAVVEFAELLADGENRRAGALKQFEKALAEGRVAEVLVSDRNGRWRLKSPDSRGKTTIVATRVEPDLAERAVQFFDVPMRELVESTQLRDVLS